MKAYETVLRRLAENRKEGYLVGGCVRDAIMGRVPNDYDVATNALPEETERIFADFRCIETGIKHGTVTVLVAGEPIEITTYRTEKGYADHRHPDAVEFSSDLVSDLSRRDFTVNAMAMALDGTVVDPFGGKKDAEKKVIRCVGDPYRRFEEDALRILRALRFSAQLGFAIDEQTARAAGELASSLRYVSRERCFVELKKLLLGVNAERVILENRIVLSALIPQLLDLYGFDQNNPHHVYTLDVHTAKAVAACPPDPVLRLAALFHDIGKPGTETKDDNGISHFYGHAVKSADMTDAILRELKCDNKTRENVVFLVRHHDAPPEESKEQVLKKLNRYGEERYRMLVALRRADNMGQAEEYHRSDLHDRCLLWLDEIQREKHCFSIKDLKIDGNDLIEIGVPPSGETGRILRTLLDEVLEGETENEREALIVRAKELHKT